jgi:3-phenylpropionate/trans-cinnamate dioxygenase ferredoxin subunit
VADEIMFVKVCAVSQIDPGTAVSADVDGTQIAIVHTTCPEGEDGQEGVDAFYAIYDECSHAEIPLSEGEIDGCTLECWLHGSRFDLRTGEPTGLPATEPVPVYPVEVRDGDIYVSLNPSNGVRQVSELLASDQTIRQLRTGPVETQRRTDHRGVGA